MAGFSFERRPVREDDGTYVVEFLGSTIALLAFVLIITQVVLVFLNAILVNHALGLAAQEAAARGGVDDNVNFMFIRHLPKGLRDQQPPQTALKSNARVPGTITPGSEPTLNNDVIRIVYEYDQSFGLMKLVGLDASVHMKRSVKVASQSAKE